VSDNLQADYKVEVPPSVLKVAGHAFSFFAYNSPVAQLHCMFLLPKSAAMRWNWCSQPGYEAAQDYDSGDG